MKVGLIHPQYRPDGGGETAIVHTLNAFEHLCIEVKLVSRQWTELDRNVQVVKCNPFYIGRLWREWSFAYRAKSLLSTLDVDIIQSQVKLPGCDIFRAGGGVHREWLKQRQRISGPIRNFHTKISAFHAYILDTERKLYADPHLKAVICNSHMVKEEIIDYFKFPGEKIHVIYNAVDHQRFDHRNNIEIRKFLRGKHGVTKNDTIFLFVGSGFERKGLSILLDSMALLPNDCFLWIVGKDNQSKKYLRKCKHLGITNRVKFFGMQKDSNIFFAAADVFVLPTLYDPFANTVLEAMSSSLPVVTSFKCGAVDIISNQNNGFVCDSLDIETITKYMLDLRDPVLRLSVGQHGRKTVEGFTTENMSHQLSSLYKRILWS